MSRFARTALTALALLIFPAPAFALEPLGPQFRVSDTGPPGDPGYDAERPDLAYDPERNRFLAVWQAYENAECEIWGQLRAADGTPLGTEFRISDMGPDGLDIYAARRPAVAYNAQEDEYLVVWEGDDNTGALANNELEIFAQRVSADGAEVEPNDVRVSHMGPDGSATYDAAEPDVSYASKTNRYLVVWSATGTLAVAPGEKEIYGEALDAAGAPIGPDDQRISEAGALADPDHDALHPAVAYSPQEDEHLVVWDAPHAADGATEIFGGRVNSAGVPVGGNDFRLSDAGPDGNTSFEADTPDVTHNRKRNEYLVVWEGDDDTGTLVDDEREIFGQRVNASGVEVDPNDLRISSVGADGNALVDPSSATVAYGEQSDEYVVAWEQDDDTPPVVNGELEIHARRLGADAAPLGGAFRVSRMEPDGDSDYDGQFASVAAGSQGEFLVTWEGDDSRPPLVDEEFEIFARRLGTPPPFGGDDPQTPGVDTTAPRLTLRAARRQRLRRERTISLRAGCDEACTVAASVAVRVAGRRRAIMRKAAPRPLAYAASTRIRLRLTRRQAATVRRALRGGRRVTATFTATATDPAANVTRQRARSRLVRR